MTKTTVKQKKRKNNREPMRTCVACRSKSPKREMIRFVLNEKAEPTLDEKGNVSGRGANICASTECFENAVEKGAFSRAWKTSIQKDSWKKVRDDLKESLAEKKFRKNKRQVTIRMKKDDVESALGKPVTRQLTGDE